MEKGFEREVLDRLTVIETKLDDYNKIKEKTDDAHNLSIQNERDINEIKDKIKWLSRTVAGGIIAGIISLIFALIQINPK